MNIRPTTKVEVARLAGVSHVTVTRVLNNFPLIRPQTRRKVLAACRTLRYRPNLLAAGLRRNKSGAIGVVVPTVRHQYYARLLDAIEKTAAARDGCHIIIRQSRHRGDRIHLPWEDLEFLLARQIDGLLLSLPPTAGLCRRLAGENTPVVFTDVEPAPRRFSFVNSADIEGTRQLTQYLLQLGHRRIAFLAGPDFSDSSQRRLAGYRTALADAGVPFDERLVAYTNYLTDGGLKAADRLMETSRPLFTALVGANDYVTVGALTALLRKGVRVPDDVSLACLGGDEISTYAVPSLTVMELPAEEIGARAVAILLEMIKNPARPAERIRFPMSFIPRSSVAVPRVTSTVSLGKDGTTGRLVQ